MTHTFRIITKTDTNGIHEFLSEGQEFIVEIDGVPIVGFQNIEKGVGEIGVYPDGEHFRPRVAVAIADPVVDEDEHYLTRAAQMAIGEDDEDLKTDLDSMKIWSPWDAETAIGLNVFQKRGSFHPFTCPNHSGEGSLPLYATEDGWVCPAADCDYTQDWAWIAMIDAKNWLTQGEKVRPPEGCVCSVSGSNGDWRISTWNPLCKMHPQLEGTHLDPEVQLVQADRPFHKGGGSVLREVGTWKEEMTSEEFDALMAKGTPVELDVQLNRKREGE